MADSEQKAVPYEAMRSAVISMAVESWRFRRTFVRVLDKLDAGERNRYEGSLNWFMKKTCEALEQAGLTVADYEGQNFDVGMAATPLNIDEFEADDALIVDQLLEPTIMGKDGVVRKTGTITLKKKA
ncbi:MAG: hypothetical protein LBB74_05250 [Chitinispirillales bacterium]|nr:hypothetical protein [Chitinispirillales bacterium]